MFDFPKCPYETSEITNEIKAMPAPIIRGFATTVRCYADELERIAADAERDMLAELKSRKRRSQINIASHFVGELIEKGVDPTQAINRASHRYHVRTDHLRILWPEFKKRLKTTKAIKTSRRAMKLYRAGLTDEDIAKKLKISARHARRIISHELKAIETL